MSSSPAAAPGPVLKQPLKMALIQLASGMDKSANLKHAADQVAKAAASGSKLVVLPECFNSPYGTNYFPEYAEVLLPSPNPKDAPSYAALSNMAKDNQVFLVSSLLSTPYNRHTPSAHSQTRSAAPSPSTTPRPRSTTTHP